MMDGRAHILRGRAATREDAPDLREEVEQRLAVYSSLAFRVAYAVPEVLIPPRDVEATRRFLAGRHRWRLLQETPPPREVEALESPAVVDWELESRRAQGFAVRVLESWPLMPSD